MGGKKVNSLLKIFSYIYPLFDKMSILICNSFAFVQDNFTEPVFSSYKKETKEKIFSNALS